MIRLAAVTLHRTDLRARLPFRYGVTTMTEMPHVFLAAEWEIDGVAQRGLAAENLPPKWFTKSPGIDPAVEIEEMLEVIRRAASFALAAQPARNVFAAWNALQEAMLAWGVASNVPPLLGGLGTSLVERSLLDAFCRRRGVTLAAAVRENLLGIELGAIHPELAGTAPGDWLPSAPLSSVTIRHTVGLVDALDQAEVVFPLHDGLPESLEAAIAIYGLREFKIKLSGDPACDASRLVRAFDVIDREACAGWRFSLDGNEAFASAAEFRAAWSELGAHPAVRRRLGRLLFVEQPVGRAAALMPDAGVRGWDGAPPLLIDESDGQPEDLRAALALGYRGVSHKNCKGIFRGIANACLIRRRRADAGGRPLFTSGEDLANAGPVALAQDLAVQAMLGNRSVERNGHHYFRGLSHWPEGWQSEVAAAHPDLYERPTEGPAAVRIRDGCLTLDSINRAPFGCGPQLDPKFLPTATAALAPF